MPRIPVFLLSGFLGSGKTTLLKALLGDARFANTAVVMNEFGAIGLDHLMLERGSDSVVLLESGCICCTLSDSVHETLADLYFRRTRGELPPFDRVVIETTGLADPAPILNTLLGNRLVTDHYRFEAAVVTVDSQHALGNMAANPEVEKQIAVADRLVLTKLDVAEAKADLRSRIAHLNREARVLESRQGDAALEAFAPASIPRVLAEAAPSQHHHGHSHASPHGEEIASFSFILEQPISWAGLAAWTRLATETFADRLLRCKGLLQVADGGEIVFLQGVQGIFHFSERLKHWPDDDHRSRLVCIGRSLDEAKLRASLQALYLPAGSDPYLTLPELEPANQRNY
jgi:G3E family GTPase